MGERVQGVAERMFTRRFPWFQDGFANPRDLGPLLLRSDLRKIQFFWSRGSYFLFRGAALPVWRLKTMRFRSWSAALRSDREAPRRDLVTARTRACPDGPGTPR